MLAKKEYELIAGVIKDLSNQPSKDEVVNQFTNRLELDSPRFDKEKFIKACFNNDTNNNG